MMLLKKLTFFLLVINPILMNAQSEMIFNGIHLEDSLEKVTQRAKEISDTSNLISIDNPIFPTA